MQIKLSKCAHIMVIGHSNDTVSDMFLFLDYYIYLI